MNKILADAINYSKQYLRSRSAAFFMFAMPIILVLVFGSIFSSSTTKLDVQVQNLDEGQSGAAYLKILNETGSVNVKMIPKDVNLAQYIKDNSLSVAVMIPGNFSTSLAESLAANGSLPVDITVYGDPSQSTFGSVMTSVQTAESIMNFHFANARPVLVVSVQSVASDKFENMDYFLPGVVGITIMTNALYGMTAVCAEYKSKGYSKLLATTTLTKGEWLTSKVLTYSVLLSASVVVTYVVAVLVLGLHVSLTPMTFALIPAGAFLFTSAGMLLGSVSKDAESASAIANAIGFPMMFLSGSFFPVELMPDFLQVVAKGMPMTYLNNAFRDTMLFNNDVSALANMGILLAIGAVLFIAGSKLMSWKEK
jgi:ABC-2 type transport system permease protein